MPVAFMATTRLIVSNNNHFLANFVTVIGSFSSERFPLGTRLPCFCQVGELFIKIILVLFYGEAWCSQWKRRSKSELWIISSWVVLANNLYQLGLLLGVHNLMLKMYLIFKCWKENKIFCSINVSIKHKIIIFLLPKVLTLFRF